MAQKKLGGRPRAVVIVLIAVQAVVGTITVRDISQRRPELVRGPKLFWKVWGGSNTLGSAAYWLFGRRRQSLQARPQLAGYLVEDRADRGALAVVKGVGRRGDADREVAAVGVAA